MTKKVTPHRTMDIHLLSRIEDDESPFGVEYNTRRLTLDPSGKVTCDDPADALWQELAEGIPVFGEKDGGIAKPRDGARFLDRISDFVRYHYLSPLTPLVYDHRGSWRPDNFRIMWKPTKQLSGADGYLFLCERPDDRKSDGRGGAVPVAMLDGWGFYHDVEALAREPAKPGRSEPRVVTVDLLPQRNVAWKETVLGTQAGPRETKAFVRAFLRRFFERCGIGLVLEREGQCGPFSWLGGA